MVTVDFRTRSELKALAAALLLLAVVLSLYVAMAPAGPTEGTASAGRLRPGPHAVGRVDLELSDDTRPTRENGSFPGAPNRKLPATLWFPEQGGRRAPARRLQPRLHVDAQRGRAQCGASREPWLRGDRGRLPALELSRTGRSDRHGRRESARRRLVPDRHRHGLERRPSARSAGRSIPSESARRASRSAASRRRSPPSIRRGATPGSPRRSRSRDSPRCSRRACSRTHTCRSS